MLRTLLCIGMWLACGVGLAWSERPTIPITVDTFLVVDPDEADPIQLAVRHLQRDMERVFGRRPEVVGTVADAEGPALVVVGPASSSVAFPDLSPVTGWEAHRVHVARADKQVAHVVMQGADMRGTIYAIYRFSEDVLGIPPLWFWVNHQPDPRERIDVPIDLAVDVASPEVRWRVLYPNDQRQLSHWRGRVDRVYRDIHFETALRLRLNTFQVIWTMDSRFDRPNRLLRDVEVAHQHGMVVTSAHAFGAHPGRERWDNFWRNIRQVDPPPGRSLEDAAAFIDFWIYHIEAPIYHDLEIIYGLGFRGDGDVGFWQRDNVEDPGSDESRAAVIEAILQRQVELAQQVIGEPAPLMTYTIYTENCDFVARGLLNIPRSPHLIYQFSSARRDHFPSPSLLGFHFAPDQLVGYYFNCQFTSTGSHLVPGEGPHKMEWNFRTVRDRSPTGLTLGRVNAGNVREHLMEIAAFAALMWDFESYDSSDFIRAFSARYFGQEQAEDIARLYEAFYRAYWRQRGPDLEGYDRQYIFQDLRLHRSIPILVDVLQGQPTNLNPFPGGDWYRIDPAFTVADSEVDALARGLGLSASELRALAVQAETLSGRLDLSHRSFFDESLRLHIEVLLALTESVRLLSEAVLAQDRDDMDARAEFIELAYAELSRLDTLLDAAAQGIWQGWYDPVRDESRGSIFRLPERLQDIRKLQ